MKESTLKQCMRMSPRENLISLKGIVMFLCLFFIITLPIKKKIKKESLQNI